jgi:hypothetical protein
MTAALFNNLNGNFANVVDGFVYPQFIGYAMRAPSTQDIYNPGTRWQDNSVNPAIIYQTSGAGRWYVTSGIPVVSVSGTTAAMVAGAVTITNAAIIAGSEIIYSRATTGGTVGHVSITAQTTGSATLTSASATETSTFTYIIVN